ncbi:hypothetical protein EDD90_2938 [Streptomyces sp. Ag109_O5-1]|uniref:hypothetical protein n=1 Tax=Streptomyces sp. Ag109_O5-1 TaxID=1938851 RepID=UPI000F4F8EEE|nr:hypothetical protein [Streptomyces sp. Ag109_O5-1]RPE39914.1 hypothetical protein EDD90_2938 [Streptomyces sp. Ag109_O5-1]
MTATVHPTPIPGTTPSSKPLRIPSAPLGSSPTAVLDPLSGRITGGLTYQPYQPAFPGAVPLGGQVQPTPVSARWLMAAGRDCLRTSHVDRLMADAARLRTVSEAGPAGHTAWDSEAWDSEEDHEVRDPAARPQIPAVYVSPTAR